MAGFDLNEDGYYKEEDAEIEGTFARGRPEAAAMILKPGHRNHYSNLHKAAVGFWDAASCRPATACA